ncbi:MAG: DUF6089 family protein [Saprospiraceae bacterium]|nr:DUF6089 family protein [Saprospiraceae bacterium]MDW8483895.1 DUF6089 family protein [Saprospiraceae bacterium]
MRTRPLGLKLGVFLFALLTSLSSVQGQLRRIPRFWEVGAGLYGSNYSGDLAPDHISFSNTRFGASLFLRYHWSPTFQLRSQLNYVQLAGDDRLHPPNANRSFRFTSNTIETMGSLELSLVNIAYDPPGGSHTYYFSPYIFAGVGIAFSAPKVVYYGPPSERYRFEREPIPEGGRAQQTVGIFPFGVGMRLIASDFVALGLEACARPAPSDLVDGVSRNGNPKRKDWYYTAGLTVSYFLNGPWYLKN